MVELGDERMFQPIDTGLRRHDGEHRLCASYFSTDAGTNDERRPTYEIVHKTLFPRNHPKLFGSAKPSLKLKVDPDSSMRFRNATTSNISASVKRSTISVEHNCERSERAQQ